MSSQHQTMVIKAHELRQGYVVDDGEHDELEVEFVVGGLVGKDYITVWFVDVDDPEDYDYDGDVTVLVDSVEY